VSSSAPLSKPHTHAVTLAAVAPWDKPFPIPRRERLRPGKGRCIQGGLAKRSRAAQAPCEAGLDSRWSYVEHPNRSVVSSNCTDLAIRLTADHPRNSVHLSDWESLRKTTPVAVQGDGWREYVEHPNTCRRLPSGRTNLADCRAQLPHSNSLSARPPATLVEVLVVKT